MSNLKTQIPNSMKPGFFSNMWEKIAGGSLSDKIEDLTEVLVNQTITAIDTIVSPKEGQLTFDILNVPIGEEENDPFERMFYKIITSIEREVVSSINKTNVTLNDDTLELLQSTYSGIVENIMTNEQFTGDITERAMSFISDTALTDDIKKNDTIVRALSYFTLKTMTKVTDSFKIKEFEIDLKELSSKNTSIDDNVYGLFETVMATTNKTLQSIISADIKKYVEKGELSTLTSRMLKNINSVFFGNRDSGDSDNKGGTMFEKLILSTFNKFDEFLNSPIDDTNVSVFSSGVGELVKSVVSSVSKVYTFDEEFLTKVQTNMFNSLNEVIVDDFKNRLGEVEIDFNFEQMYNQILSNFNTNFEAYNENILSETNKHLSDIKEKADLMIKELKNIVDKMGEINGKQFLEPLEKLNNLLDTFGADINMEELMGDVKTIKDNMVAMGVVMNVNVANTNANQETEESEPFG
jgi:hypothetical protein